ncbi:hypothetical protein RRG08_031940 [Elysia crispata]|uniref:Uncharacterized protein n=1 Tax=Elysia crispata TaxID=231223 RepID=A0AAE1DYH3_9GAST|nr:hypothetical protein RRG08_031940 [Elysia crispata]
MGGLTESARSGGQEINGSVTSLCVLPWREVTNKLPNLAPSRRPNGLRIFVSGVSSSASSGSNDVLMSFHPKSPGHSSRARRQTWENWL